MIYMNKTDDFWHLFVNYFDEKYTSIIRFAYCYYLLLITEINTYVSCGLYHLMV